MKSENDTECEACNPPIPKQRDVCRASDSLSGNSPMDVTVSAPVGNVVWSSFTELRNMSDALCKRGF